MAGDAARGGPTHAKRKSCLELPLDGCGTAPDFLKNTAASLCRTQAIDATASTCVARLPEEDAGSHEAILASSQRLRRFAVAHDG